MNFKKAVLVSTLMAMAPSAVFAQTGFLGVRPVIAQSPGNYQFRTLDQAALNAQLAKLIDQSRNNDRLFLLQKHDEINQAFKQVAESEYRDLQQMSLKSTSAPVTYFEYVTKTQAYFVKRLEIKQMIESLVQIPDAMSRSANSAAAGDATITLQGQLQLNLSAIVKPMNDQLNILDGAAQALSFNVTLPNGVVQQVQNINADGIDKSNLISQEYLNSLTLDVAQSKARVLDQQTKNILANINRQTNTLVQSFINNQGMTQRWRVFKPTDQFAQSEIKDLTEAFWLRSFVRAKYGIPVGAIGVAYKKKALNLDRMFSPDNLDIRLLPIGTNQADLNAFGSQMAEAIKTYDGQANLGGNPLNLVAWTINRVKGKWNQAEANILVVKLLAADLYEEMAVMKGGGLRAMHERYKGRYGVNPGMKDYYKKLQCSYDGCGEDDAYADVGIANDASMRGLYATQKPILDNMLARQEIADRKQQALLQLTSSFGTLRKADQRSKSLLD